MMAVTVVEGERGVQAKRTGRFPWLKILFKLVKQIMN